MNDLDKEIDKKDRIKGSLALRIFLITLILLILPLFVHSLWMYAEEYEEKKQELGQTLKTLGANKALLVSQALYYQKDVLSTLTNPTRANLSQVAEKLGIYEAFYLNKDYLVINSSNSRIIGKSYLAFKVILQNKTQVFLAKDPISMQNIVYVIKNDYRDGKLQGVWVLANLPKDLIKNGIDGLSVTLSLIPNEKKVFSSDLIEKVKMEGTNFSLLASLSTGSFSNQQVKKHLYKLASLFLVIVVIGGIVTFFLIQRLSKPLKNLISVMERIYSGDKEARYKKDPLGFEMNIVGDHLNHMIESILAHQKKIEEQKVEKELLKGQLKIGKEIQMSLFPIEVPEISGLDICPYFESAHEVGGDFYDLFLSNGRLALIMADTSGKGISACLYSLGIRSILRSFLSTSSQLSNAIVQANNLFCLDTADTGFFVTAWIGLYDPKTHHLEYCSCGHYPGLLIRDGLVQPLQTNGIALGAMTISQVKTDSIDLNKDDFLFLYTDGVIDTLNSKQEHFDQARLESVLKRKKRAFSKELIDDLSLELDNFSNGAVQYDDTTMLALKLSCLF